MSEQDKAPERQGAEKAAENQTHETGGGKVELRDLEDEGEAKGGLGIPSSMPPPGCDTPGALKPTGDSFIEQLGT